MENKTKNAIIYSRVSGNKVLKKSASLAAQVLQAENYCKERGFSIIKVYSVASSSVSGDENKKAFTDLLKFIKKQKTTVALCLSNTDRLARSHCLKEVYDLLELVGEGKIELHFTSQDKVIKRYVSATDKLELGMESIFAQHHSCRTSENVRRGIEEARRQGRHIGKAPFGYQNTITAHGKTLTPDPKKKHIVRAVLTLAQQKMSNSDILKELRKKYPKHTLEMKTKGDNRYIYRILRNKDFYSGYMNFNGERYPHIYERIV